MCLARGPQRVLRLLVVRLDSGGASVEHRQTAGFVPKRNRPVAVGRRPAAGDSFVAPRA
jgi:hypothetical protein